MVHDQQLSQNSESEPISRDDDCFVSKEGEDLAVKAEADEESLDNTSSTSNQEQQHDLFRIALYYLYIPLEQNAPNHVVYQKKICEELHLNGRIRVSCEGLNGVLSGRLISLQEYEHRLKRELLYENISILSTNWDLDIKYCSLRTDLSVQSQLFHDLSVKLTDQVVSLIDHGTKQIISTEVIQRFQETNPFLMDPPLVPRLSPEEWNEKLCQLSYNPESRVVLLDCRNVYESSIGYFKAPQATTILTNTRKFSELPRVLVEYAKILAESTHIFSYCTGGVRCESATLLLHEILHNTTKYKNSIINNNSTSQLDCTTNTTSTSTSTIITHHVPQIYQLHGGIQKYLESNHTQYYYGKNFVFDPRRTDPHHTPEIVGCCLVCGQAHDDYDNGHAPCDNQEARCCKCRIMILVCMNCRPTVTCWNDIVEVSKQPLYCGGLEKDCVHMPPIRVINPDQDNVI